MKEIPLTQGQTALVDDEDFVWLSQWQWSARWDKGTQSFYAIRSVYVSNAGKKGKQWTMLMHRQILGLDKGDRRHGDHRNHNTLDNQRHNLRISTPAQNQHNDRKRSDNTTGFKGVSLKKSLGKYSASIAVKGKSKHLGYFSTPEEAAQRYDIAARDLYGEFACGNETQLAA